ncbi:C2HC5 finger protein [Pleurostoma richardsiae]|uniref:C2HC5 finger protein n=1 Tax=Pleurostoma richardsiae TaxID=41990 RepID=A0AA38VF41_9PEZI|nr:C2HC5 finger protein [Pleurostoma richardsiae]
MSLIQLSRLIDLPDADLRQALEYASTLSKQEAAKHFENLLGDSPQAIEFISAFNSRRQDPIATLLAPRCSQMSVLTATPSSDIEAMPKLRRAARKKKAPLHTPVARPLVDLGTNVGTAYSKKALQDDYISQNPAEPSASSRNPPMNPTSGISDTKSSTLLQSSRPPPSAAGPLVSDGLHAPRSKQKSKQSSRISVPRPASDGSSTVSTKVSVIGGTAMHGASAVIADLDAAIRSLEITTNPSLHDDAGTAIRRCNCVATRHPLQAAAPNCLNCGKVVCVKEGLGPCSFCGTPLLSSKEVQAMIKELKAERGRERMAADRQAHKRPDVAGTSRPFAKPRTGPEPELDDAEEKAREHRDKLLGFQAQNARRTTVRDEAADFDISGAMAGSFGGSIWASPEDRARELKRQQKLLREVEWNARPDYEKRKQVLSIDLVGGKVVKKMAPSERPPSPSEEDIQHRATGLLQNSDANGGGGRGAFSKNPLLGGMIKPVYNPKGEIAESRGREDKSAQWRRVQDDLDDNEGVILDGGIYAGRKGDGAGDVAAVDEPKCG